MAAETKKGGATFLCHEIALKFTKGAIAGLGPGQVIPSTCLPATDGEAIICLRMGYSAVVGTDATAAIELHHWRGVIERLWGLSSGALSAGAGLQTLPDPHILVVDLVHRIKQEGAYLFGVRFESTAVQRANTHKLRLLPSAVLRNVFNIVRPALTSTELISALARCEEFKPKPDLSVAEMAGLCAVCEVSMPTSAMLRDYETALQSYLDVALR